MGRWALAAMLIHFLVMANLAFGCTLIYDSPDELYSFLRHIEDKYRDTTRLLEIGRTYENRPIYCIRIRSRPVDESVIVVEFGAHAREWVSHFSAPYVISHLAKRFRLELFREKYSWYILPLLNPDGFAYSKSSVVQSLRLWRKNRRRTLDEDLGEDDFCAGIDLNRNFPTGWRYKERSECNADYSGEKPLSENETQALYKLMESFPKGKVAAYVSVHANAQAVAFPFSHTQSPPRTFGRLYDVAEAMRSAMEALGEEKFDVFQASERFLSGGTVIDWVYEAQAVPLVFALQLPFKNRHPDEYFATTSEHCHLAQLTMAALETCEIKASSSPSLLMGTSSVFWAYVNCFLLIKKSRT